MMKCPRDNSELKAQSKARDVCPECGGVLLNIEQSNHSALRRLPYLAQGAEPSPLNCPKTGLAMKLLVINGMEIDYCRASNLVWLDKGELQKIKAGAEAQQSGSSITDSVADGIVVGTVELVVEGAGAVLGGLLSLIDI